MGVPFQPRRLLVVGDDATLFRSVAAVGAHAGWEVTSADRPEGTAQFADKWHLDPGASAVLIDARQERSKARELVGHLARRPSPVPTLVVTDAFCVNERAEFLKAGAIDYLSFPVQRNALLRALRLGVSASEPTSLQPLSESLEQEPCLEGLVGSEPGFREALAVAAKAARSSDNLVIQGEGGTGKMLVGRAVHAASNRRMKAFQVVRVRGLTIPELQSALFGHEAGSRLGAFDRRRGALELCDGGTLLLHEVNRLPSEVQEQLAHSILAKRVQPQGAGYSFSVDVRVIATSSKPLLNLVAVGEFSEALYSTLAQFEVKLPPLRERRRDIPALARHFLRAISAQPGSSELTLADSALAVLSSYPWPGNVGQLQSAIVRAAASCDGDVLKPSNFADLTSDEAEVPRGVRSSDADALLFAEDGNLRSLKDIERDVIRLAIGMYRGRMTEVARRLGIGRSTLYRKIEELDATSRPSEN